MHVTHLDDDASSLTVSSASPFRHKEWRNLLLVTEAPCLRSEQRH